MQENATRASSSRAIPFDAAKLDRLMEAAGIDVLVATSKHNVQYLLGGQRAIFFDYMDAMGVSRYLPVLVYPKGAPEQGRLCRPPAGDPPARSDAALGAAGPDQSSARSTRCTRAVEHLESPACRRSGSASRWRSCRWTPATALRDALPGAELKDALLVLERLRAVSRRTSWRSSRRRRNW